MLLQIIIETLTGHPYLGSFLKGEPYFDQFRQLMFERGIGVDTAIMIISLPLGFLFRIRLLRWGSRCLLKLPLDLYSYRKEASSGSSAIDLATFVGASIMLLAAILSAATDLLANIGCAYLLEGRLPSWLTQVSLNFLRHDCQASYWVGVDFVDVSLFTLPGSIAVVAEASILWAGGRRRLFAKPRHVSSGLQTGRQAAAGTDQSVVPLDVVTGPDLKASSPS